MEKFRFLDKNKINQLPKTAGVYALKKSDGFLYVGKAVNLRERVKNHFGKTGYRDNLFMNQAQKIGYIKTDSEIEALILEANLIKKYQPKYNVMWRDDKNYFFVGITKENFSRVFITHQTKLKIDYIGPFVDGRALRQTLRILRKAFPYYTVKKHPLALCSWCHLGLCPGPNPVKSEYQKNIRNLIAVLKGKRKNILEKLKIEMRLASKRNDFEKAAAVRDQILALEKVISHTRTKRRVKIRFISSTVWKKTEKELKKILKTRKKISKIEAYDVSNIQGKMATGSMVTFINGKPNKNLYRKFKIRIEGKPNDTAMIKETLSRRLAHEEWGFPDLILIDGGRGQLNIALRCLKPEFQRIGAMALAKRKNELFVEGRKEPVFLKSLPREIFNLILQLRDEAHRFALSYHRKLRDIDLKNNL